jgi:hypothetical protein
MSGKKHKVYKSKSVALLMVEKNKSSDINYLKKTAEKKIRQYEFLDSLRNYLPSMFHPVFERTQGRRAEDIGNIVDQYLQKVYGKVASNNFKYVSNSELENL